MKESEKVAERMVARKTKVLAMQHIFRSSVFIKFSSECAVSPRRKLHTNNHGEVDSVSGTVN